MNQYIIALVISNIAWFGFVVMLLKSFHELRMKMERQFDTIRERHEDQLATASDNLRTANRMAEDLRKESNRLKSQLEAVDRARDKYVTDIINNNSTIADLKSQLEKSAKTIEELLDAAERDARILAEARKHNNSLRSAVTSVFDTLSRAMEEN